jgi:hypothetical protein
MARIRADIPRTPIWRDDVEHEYAELTARLKNQVP